MLRAAWDWRGIGVGGYTENRDLVLEGMAEWWIGSGDVVSCGMSEIKWNSRSFGDHTGSAGSDAEGEGRWDLKDDWICGKAGCNRQPPFVPLFTEQRQSAASQPS
jgi:hypothetical protein